MLGQNPAIPTRAVITTSHTIGAKLPAPVLEAYERANRISTAAMSIYPPRGALVAATVAALDAGRDPAADPDVVRALIAQQIGASDGVGRLVGDTVTGEMREVFRAHANAIVKAWSKPFDAAAAALDVAHERIGDVPLDDTATILRAGGDIAAVWAQAKQATDVIDSISLAWSQLALLTGFASPDPQRAALRIATATADEWASAGFGPRNVGSWDVVVAGLPLSLADGAEYARRVAAVQEPVSVAAA